ncbi:MAG: hypothetical protein ABIQ56_03620 [Chitinophagaceae bacterium]
MCISGGEATGKIFGKAHTGIYLWFTIERRSSKERKDPRTDRLKNGSSHEWKIGRMEVHKYGSFFEQKQSNVKASG